MKDKNKLLPCPCCGGEAELRTFTSRGWLFKLTAHYVKCSACGIQTGVQLTPQEAVDIWNRRVPISAAPIFEEVGSS
jgi:Lar family restriction alleviation protein